MGHTKTEVDLYTCERCGHEWFNRKTSDVLPIRCARCKSPYWNRPKKGKPVGHPKRERPVGSKKKGKPVGEAIAPESLGPKGDLSVECKRYQHGACKGAGCGCFCH
jgi:DNA-directed RNA polymerase subunit RPC12/RpoP